MKFKHITFPQSSVSMETLSEQTPAIAQEGVVDWIKESFPKYITKENIDSMDAALARLTAVSHSSSESRQNFALNKSNAKLLFRSGRLINDLPREIRRDAVELSAIANFFKKFNNVMSKVKPDAEPGSQNNLFSSISKSDLASFNGIDLLGNIQIKFNTSGGGRTKEKDISGVPSKPNPLWYLLWLLVPGLGIFVGIIHYVTNLAAYQEQIQKFASSGSFIRRDFSEAVKELIGVLTELRDGVEKFQGYTKLLKQSDDREVEDIVTFGINLSHAVINVVKHYDELLKGV